ncbi:TetR/AcrR family transcriptional regulator [Paenibacillus mesotrionivorans]|uniref:TetR/AcrR family transcriptional regulator n=1 Tax=Paenibacillus mesotrionivorans TaxID=3160968 RepID=A0ACC7P6N4_9BACL
MNKPSLRDLKKEATAHALADAAFELAVERGLDGFVVDDVVQRAGYSRRTFANYFSCKEEAVATAVIPYSSNQQHEAERLLENLPENTSLLDALYQLMKLQFLEGLLLKMREVVSLSNTHPTLEPYILSVFRGLQNSAMETLNGLSHGRYPNGYTHLLVGAVYGAMLPVIDGTLNVLLPGDTVTDEQDATTFEEYLETTFRYLRNGF